MDYDPSNPIFAPLRPNKRNTWNGEPMDVGREYATPISCGSGIEGRVNKRNSWSAEIDNNATAHKRRGIQTKDRRPFLVSFLQTEHSAIALTNLLKFCKEHEGSWNATLGHGNRVSFFAEYAETFFDQESSQILSEYRKVSDRTLRKKFGEAEDFARTNYFRLDEGNNADIPEWGLLFCEFFRSQKRGKSTVKATTIETHCFEDEKKLEDDDDIQVPVGSHPIMAVDSLSSSVREFVREFITL